MKIFAPGGIFDQADADGDKRLSEPELKTMFELYGKMMTEVHKEWYEFTDKELAEVYVVYNRFSAEPGVTKEDMRKVAPCLNLAFA